MDFSLERSYDPPELLWMCSVRRLYDPEREITPCGCDAALAPMASEEDSDVGVDGFTTISATG
jgi:hypothetical protein